MIQVMLTDYPGYIENERADAYRLKDGNVQLLVKEEGKPSYDWRMIQTIASGYWRSVEVVDPEESIHSEEEPEEEEWV